MKRITAAVMLVLMVICVYAVAESMEEHLTPIGERTSDLSTLIGKRVENLQGDDLGTISEFVKGPEGRIAFAMLNYRATDNARKMVALPISALFCSEQHCVLNASRETVRVTPSFVSKDDLAQTRTAVDIYLNFGVQPYWSEEGTRGKK